MSIDRRIILQGLCCCSACAILGLPASARSQQEKVARLSQIKGCFVEDNNADLLLGANFSAGKHSHLPSEVKTMMRSTGDEEVDQLFDAALARLAETFDVLPKVGFYDDGDEPNAMAMRYAVAGTHEFAVVFGRNYFKSLMDYDPSGITLLQTAAHEFAHVWVYKEGLFQKIRGGQPTVKRIELHADFMSGYYLGFRKIEHPDESFLLAGYRREDSGDMQVDNVNHHGTPEERADAANAGFELGAKKRPTPRQALEAATAYVSNK